MNEHDVKKLKSYWGDKERADAYFSVIEKRLSRLAFKERTLLEVGCGKGYSTCVYAASGAKKVLGLEIDGERLSEGRKYLREIPALNERVNFVQGTSDQIPAGTKTIGGVIMNEALSHYGKPEESLNEAHRVLKPGGQLFIFDDNNQLDIRGIFRRRFKRWPPYREKYDKIRREYFEEAFPDLPKKKYESLVRLTRGTTLKELEKKQLHELLDGDVTSEHSAPRHPEIGSYAEREINPLNLKGKLENIGFDAELVPSYFSVNTNTERMLETFFQWTFPLSLLVSPGFSIIATK